MRLLHGLLLLPLFCAPAFAQTVATPAAATANAATAEHHGRRSAADHFADANTTHDGRLTLDQASSGYKAIAKSFAQIDVSHHGYVTMDDIKSWKAAKKAAKLAEKHAASDAAAGIVRPGQSIQRWLGPKPVDTSTDMIVPMASPRRTGVDLPAAPLDSPTPAPG